MDFYEVVAKRRTVRKFKGPATEAQLMRILVADPMKTSPSAPYARRSGIRKWTNRLNPASEVQTALSHAKTVSGCC